MQVAEAALHYLETHRAEVVWGAGLFVGTLLVSLAAVAVVLVRMPADYLACDEPAPFWPDRHPWLRLGARVGKNLLGVLLVAIGVVLSVPGVPGQGFLTIVIGVMLLDLPGKRAFERRLLGRPKVLAAVNRLRARFGRGALHVCVPHAGGGPSK